MEIPFGDIVFELNEDKGRRFAEKLYKMFSEKAGFYGSVTMPEWILPEGMTEGSKEHALYLTYVISVDYGVVAEKLWEKSRGTYRYNPEYFDPTYLTKASESLIRSILKGLGIRYLKNGVKTWQQITNLLIKDYDGDPRNITPSPTRLEYVKNTLQKFRALRGYKLSNFYIRAMAEKGLFKIKDLKNLNIPVDLQVVRFTTYSGVLDIKKGKFDGCLYELRKPIEIVWRKACEGTGINPFELDEPIWQIGSKLCSKKRCSLCPVNEECGHNFKPTFRAGHLLWSSSNSSFDCGAGCGIRF